MRARRRTGADAAPGAPDGRLRRIGAGHEAAGRRRDGGLQPARKGPAELLAAVRHRGADQPGAGRAAPPRQRGRLHRGPGVHGRNAGPPARRAARNAAGGPRRRRLLRRGRPRPVRAAPRRLLRVRALRALPGAQAADREPDPMAQGRPGRRVLRAGLEAGQLGQPAPHRRDPPARADPPPGRRAARWPPGTRAPSCPCPSGTPPSPPSSGARPSPSRRAASAHGRPAPPNPQFLQKLQQATVREAPVRQHRHPRPSPNHLP